MKFHQVVIMLAMISAMVMIVKASSDDSKCRSYALSHEVSQEALDKYGSFRMYGQRAGKTCQATCLSAFMNYGFDYAGKQACCCAREKTLA